MQAIAAYVGSDQPQFVDLPEPGEPGVGEVLCSTVQLGVCGTDREILLSKRPWVPERQPFIALGHECLARIDKLGPGVTSLRLGQLAVPVVRRPLQKPAFRPDMLAFGEFTERGIVCEHGFSQPRWLDRPEYLVPVDDSLRDFAVFTEPLAVAEKGINEATVVQRARLDENAWLKTPPRVLITGLGPIAFAAVMACYCRGWPMTVYGRDPSNSFRASLATEFGARYLPATEFTTDRFQAFGEIEQYGYDLILECTGSDEVMMLTAEGLASRGIMVWLGSTRIPETRVHNVELLMRNAILRNHIHLGTVNAALRDFDMAVKGLATLQSRIPETLAKVITARVNPADSLWHYIHRQPQGIKTVLHYE